MGNDDNIMNHRFKIWKENNIKTILVNYLIILLYLEYINPSLIPGNGFLSLTNYNLIILKFKAQGKVRVINPNYNFKPSFYYLGINPTPIPFQNSEIDLINSENQIELIFEVESTNCSTMFSGCSNITEIDLSYFKSSKVIDIQYMFDGCTKLKNIKFGNFQTSGLKNLNYVFRNCISLETLDLSGFDTSKVTHFHHMFYGCKSLKYLDLSTFDTSSLSCIHNMFNGCTSITSINLSSFDTSKATLMYYAFYNCKNLISLDLSSFKINSSPEMKYMFTGCEKLEFVNLELANISKVSNKEFMITNTSKNIVFCVNETNTPILNELMKPNNCSTRTYDCSNWRRYQKKIIKDLDICVDNCSLTSYPFEYLGKCYNKCPKGTVNLNSICYDCIKLGDCQDLKPTEFKDKLKGKLNSYVNSSNVIKGNNFLA